MSLTHNALPHISCYWYHKGKTFQANHNHMHALFCLSSVVIDTTKVRLFKQITTLAEHSINDRCCYWYHKGKTFQANHNIMSYIHVSRCVVIDTTKVRLFKQITTTCLRKSSIYCCYWYHKGKTFQANHNHHLRSRPQRPVVIDTTKVRLFKQITTHWRHGNGRYLLLLIPQR